ncbi:UDP-3-O-acyl-N-acetylglucosamine deacetylase [Thermostichus vulcanus]|uniref:UDP-3-O-acyl-N-acetylglucosamine deacetylase n=1 Tax=Thermostichus vulcanus str. 'Rupite' TaxID=2813851 RepID=A0ABT0CBF9_THEVL|nr:UDP-3-O-acyl-N-acetylglucosamine deacetylase [Thermostichus vulcanus]MCJ2543128.1 UDP-3-O-[3-hydroxymyristoyl] N-acetylglucosamine deacetylase [Thermostichus vulcanus str. 'Rupite']
MRVLQHTLASSISLEGIGLHTGLSVRCTLHPAPVDTGRVFVRVDQPGSPIIPAQLGSLAPAHLSTLLQNTCPEGSEGSQVQTVEHLLAALYTLGIDNCRIEVDGPELPILDGSALPFVEAIAQAGILAQDQPTLLGVIKEPVTVWVGESFVSAVPHPVARFTYGIDFANSPIGQQWLSWTASAADFVESIAPARTFTRQQDVELARQRGLIKGGSLENAIVCTETEWLGPLRYADEPVRHKLIDLLGDLSLLGYRLQGHIVAYKAGHTLHHRLSEQLLQSGSLLIHTQ